MRRLAFAPLALAALAACAPSAAPQPAAGLPEYPPPVAAPAPKAPPSAAAATAPRGPHVPLEGTTWTGTDSDGTEWSFEYRRGGALHYVLSGSAHDNGTWKQDGASVVMETNDHYADYTGVIRGSKMTGSAHNTAGKSWTFVLDRQP